MTPDTQDLVARLTSRSSTPRRQPGRTPRPPLTTLPSVRAQARLRASPRAGQADGVALMVRHRGKFVSYLRVSTKRQGAGLGLEAQRAAVEDFLNGGHWKLVEEHVEVESGKHDHNRPALAQGARGLQGLRRDAGDREARSPVPRRALPARPCRRPA